MSDTRTKGVFCLEGDWEPDLRIGTSVLPVLELLEKANVPSIPFIRRGIATLGEFEYYLQKWTLKKYSGYPILYLGFHGDPGVLYVGSGREEEVSLDWLEDHLEGRCKKRIIHFGSCGTLAVHGNRLHRFFHRTQALAICGYKMDVDWVLSAAFEIVLLSGFQENALTRSGMAAVHRRVLRQATTLARDLNFRMVVSPRS
jgi:hypothetical protein